VEAVTTDNKGMSMVVRRSKAALPEQDIGKDLAPLIKGAIAADNQRAIFTRSGQEVERSVMIS
jgi:hypothetical protein